MNDSDAKIALKKNNTEMKKKGGESRNRREDVVETLDKKEIQD